MISGHRVVALSGWRLNVRYGAQSVGRCLAAIRPKSGVKGTCRDHSNDANDPKETSLAKLLISIKVSLAISVSILGMKAKDFIVAKRPTLAKVTKHPSIGFANYERRLESMQSVMQSIQQAYLGTRERAVVVLEGWDTAGKGGIVRRLGWALDPRSFKVYPIAAPLSHERGRHYLQRFWEKLPDPGQIVVFDRSCTGEFWSSGWRVSPASTNGREATKRSMNSNA